MKPFVKTIVETEDVNIIIKPACSQKCIAIEIRNISEQFDYALLDRAEAEILIEKIQEMLKYLEL